MTDDRLTPRTTTIPIIKDSELRLAKMRRQLEDMFLSLEIAHDEIIVSAQAARSAGLPEVANVLSLSVGNRLFNQLKSLANIIERLGGRADLFEGEKPAQQASQGTTPEGEGKA